MAKILKIIWIVFVILVLCGVIGGIVYLFNGTDEPAVDNPTDDYVAVEQIILDEEGIAF